MTDKEIVEDQDVELHEDENEIMDEAHDPKNAEAQSIAATDKAADATGSAPKRKGDNTKKDPMIKTKAGMIAAIVGKMQGMNKQAITAMYQTQEGFELEGDTIAEDEIKDTVNVEVDFKDDLKALVSEEELFVVTVTTSFAIGFLPTALKNSAFVGASVFPSTNTK